MANPEHLDLALRGPEAINDYRQRYPNAQIDLSGAHLGGLDLSGADLNGAILNMANLSDADLSGVNLSHANLVRADLSDTTMVRANLRDAILVSTSLRRARLTAADLRNAELTQADLSDADLSSANLRNATLKGTIVGGAIMRHALLPFEDWNAAAACLVEVSAASLNACIFAGNSTSTPVVGQDEPLTLDSQTAGISVCFDDSNFSEDDISLVLQYLDEVYAETGGNGLKVVGGHSLKPDFVEESVE